MNRVPDMAAMQDLVSTWGTDSAAIEPPLGRWKVNDLAIGHTVDVVSLLPLPPDNIDSEISVQLIRGWWGNGYAGEAGDAIAHYASTPAPTRSSLSRPANQRAAAAARMGMDWVGHRQVLQHETRRVPLASIRPGRTGGRSAAGSRGGG